MAPISVCEVQVNIKSSQMTYQVPTQWSINKLKCLLCSEVPSLDFDQFQLKKQDQLLRGNHKLEQIRETSERKIPFTVDVIKTKSEITLKQYYSQMMGSFMKDCDYQSQPILSAGYQKFKNLTSGEDANANAQRDDAELALALQEEENPENQLHPLFRFLQILGIYLMVMLVVQHGRFYQVLVIVAVVILFYIIEFYRRFYQRRAVQAQQNQRNQQNAGQAQQQPVQGRFQDVQENVFKGLLYLYGFKALQMVYVFFFTMFPNLDMQMYLNSNQERLHQAQQLVNRLRPGTYPLRQ